MPPFIPRSKKEASAIAEAGWRFKLPRANAVSPAPVGLGHMTLDTSPLLVFHSSTAEYCMSSLPAPHMTLPQYVKKPGVNFGCNQVPRFDRAAQYSCCRIHRSKHAVVVSIVPDGKTASRGSSIPGAFRLCCLTFRKPETQSLTALC